MFLKLTTKRIIVTLFTAITLPLIVISCGGGSGAPANTGPSLSAAVISNQSIKIDATNSTQIVSKALLSISSGSGVGSTPTVATIENTEAISKETITKITKNLISQIHSSNSISASILGAVASCTNGGSITGPDNFPTSGAVISGTYTFTFNNCKEGTTTTNGSVTIVASGTTTIDANGVPTDITATVTFNNLTASDVGTIISINGGFTISFKSNASATAASFSGTNLTIRDANGAISLTNFNITFDDNKVGNIQTLSINYTLSSTFIINGSITVKTNVPFVTRNGRVYPSEGEILITGAGGSSILLTVNAGGTGLSTDKVTLIINDGTVIVTQVKMWSEL